MLLLREGQTGKAWEPSVIQCSFVHREALDKKKDLHIFVLKGLSKDTSWAYTDIT